MFAGCLAVGLACGDQRRLTGSGSALEALRDDALYKSTYFTFFTVFTELFKVSIACAVWRCGQLTTDATQLLQRACPQTSRLYRTDVCLQFKQYNNIDTTLLCQVSSGSAGLSLSERLLNLRYIA